MAEEPTSSVRIGEPTARAFRTATQGGTAWVLTEFADAWLYDMTERQFGALVALLTLLLAWGQALVENHYGKGFLRAIPPKKVPLID